MYSNIVVDDLTEDRVTKESVEGCVSFIWSAVIPEFDVVLSITVSIEAIAPRIGEDYVDAGMVYFKDIYFTVPGDLEDNGWRFRKADSVYGAISSSLRLRRAVGEALLLKAKEESWA